MLESLLDVLSAILHQVATIVVGTTPPALEARRTHYGHYALLLAWPRTSPTEANRAPDDIQNARQLRDSFSQVFPSVPALALTTQPFTLGLDQNSRAQGIEGSPLRQPAATPKTERFIRGRHPNTLHSPPIPRCNPRSCDLQNLEAIIGPVAANVPQDPVEIGFRSVEWLRFIFSCARNYSILLLRIY